MTPDIDHDAVAEALDRAATTRTPIAPHAATYPGFDVAAAYAVQSRVIARLQVEGVRRVGCKVGPTSVAKQRQLGVDEPDVGPLLDDMAAPDGGTVDRTEFIAPRVEAELAFRLARDLRGPGVELGDVVAATASVIPALEIIDSRIANRRIALADTIADHARRGGPGCERTRPCSARAGDASSEGWRT